ncbi:hypothetical protein [Pseudomonas coronafaciens]|uniref:hypothetical protein n=1 Tax=Pseudomonas coronafaciens TaxID=53409 RepID=UPI0037B73B08
MSTALTKELSKDDYKAIVGETVRSTKAYNDKQEYVDNNTTYFERYESDERDILKAAKIDHEISGQERWQIDCILGAKQIVDTINTDPELGVLKKALEAKEISVDGFGKNYPVVYIEHEAYVKNNEKNDVISIEPKDGSLIGNGYQVTVNHGEDDVYARSLKDGLKEVQKTLQSYAPEYREKKDNKIKPKM